MIKIFKKVYHKIHAWICYRRTRNIILKNLREYDAQVFWKKIEELIDKYGEMEIRLQKITSEDSVNIYLPFSGKNYIFKIMPRDLPPDKAQWFSVLAGGDKDSTLLMALPVFFEKMQEEDFEKYWKKNNG